MECPVALSAKERSPVTGGFGFAGVGEGFNFAGARVIRVK